MSASDQDRLVEGADQILAVGGIDRGLAADRGIDLRQQRGRNLHVIEAAPHYRRGEAGKIADDATAERNHQIAALHPRRDDRLADLLEHSIAFRGLAGRHDGAVHRHAGSGQRRLGARQHVARHVVVGDNENLGARPQRRDPRAKSGNNAAFDDDLVAARTEQNLDNSGSAANDCRHGPPLGRHLSPANPDR